MARSEALWTDLVTCPDCGAVNDARDEWCEKCLADINDEARPLMFVRRWAHPGRVAAHKRSAS